MDTFPMLRWFCSATLLFLLAPPYAPAADPPPDPASGSAQTGAADELPPRLAPLGLEKLMEMEVSTVTRRASTVGNSPAAIAVITQEDIRRSGITMIPELLRRVPGINVARIDNNKWAISARGFAERFFGKMLVQIDGRTLYNPFTSGVYWDAVDYPLEDIDRIEVIRGPRAGVWGANAVNGIINIITKSSKETQGGMLSGGWGNQERGFGTFRYGGKLQDAAHWRLYGKGFTRAKQYARDADPHDEWDGASGGFRLDWQPEGNLLTVQGDYLHSDADRHDFRAQPTPPFLFENLETEETDNLNLLLRWTRTVSEDSSWTLQAYWDTFQRYLHALEIPFRWDTYDLDLQHQVSLREGHRLLWGVGYRLVDSFIGGSGRDGGFVFRLTESGHDNQTVSLYGQYEAAFLDNKLRLFLNSRLEHNDFTGVEVQPAAQILYTPTNTTSLWASVARAVRTPNLNETYASPRLLPLSTAPPLFPRQVPNAEIGSESVLSYQLGYRVQPTEELTFDTTLFYNFYDDLVTQSAGAPVTGAVGRDLPVRLVNGVEGDTFGAELAATWQVARWLRLYGAYSYLQILLERSDPRLPPTVEAAEGLSPQNQLYLHAAADLPRQVEVDFTGRWVARLSGFNLSGAPGVANEIPSYFALDARLAWRARKNLEVAVVGQNLLDSHHPEFGTSFLVRSPLVEMRRAGYAKVTWRF